MNILLVDDEPSFRLLVGDYLSEQGHTVFLADDGEEGIRKVIHEKIDVVISDLHMHVMDGATFCKSSRALPGFRDLPFLFVSAYEDEGTLAAIRSFENSMFLRKGGPMSEIIKWVNYLTTPTEQGGGFSPAQEEPAPSSLVPAQKAAPPAAIGRNGKDPAKSPILIVDDDDALRLTLADLLTREGYTVSEAADGQEAMELVEKQYFDLILLDVVMPSVSGFEVLKFVKEKTPWTKVIMLTAYSDLKLAVESKRLGAADFIAKPFMQPDLLNTIEQVLSK